MDNMAGNSENDFADCTSDKRTDSRIDSGTDNAEMPTIVDMLNADIDSSDVYETLERSIAALEATRDIGQTLAKLFSAAVPGREQLIEKQKEYTEERRNRRKRHWAESIRSTHKNLTGEGGNRVKVTSGRICEDLFWGKDRMTAIENARPSDLKVIELFDLADYLGIPPMLLIGETTEREEYARELFNSLTCEQQDTCLALMKSIAGSGQTASDGSASETGI